MNPRLQVGPGQLGLQDRSKCGGTLSPLPPANQRKPAVQELSSWRDIWETWIYATLNASNVLNPKSDRSVFRISDLPSELRLLIFHQCLDPLQTNNEPNHMLIRALRVAPTLCQEALGIIYANGEFTLRAENVRPAVLGRARKLRLEYTQWFGGGGRMKVIPSILPSFPITLVAKCTSVQHVSLTTKITPPAELEDIKDWGMLKLVGQMVKNIVLSLPQLKTLTLVLPNGNLLDTRSRGKRAFDILTAKLVENITYSTRIAVIMLPDEGSQKVAKWEADPGQQITWTGPEHVLSFPRRNMNLMYVLVSRLHGTSRLEEINCHYLGLNPRIIRYCPVKQCLCNALIPTGVFRFSGGDCYILPPVQPSVRSQT